MYDEREFRRETTLLLLASGDSVRFSQGKFPKKQWLKVGENPLWRHLVDVFLGFGFEKIFVVISQAEVGYARKFFPSILQGGKTRQESILKALESVTSPYVLIHDVARFHPVADVVDRLFDEALRDPMISCVAPRLEIADTLYHQGGDYPKREEYFLIQTPQLSKVQDLRDALMQGEFSDESSALASHKKKVAFTQGSPMLHKMTYPHDLYYLKNHACGIGEHRIGSGIDIHAFEKGKKMMLGGVEIASDVGFRAHSDGDVAIHSIIDAILGAIGAGDIGEWFPDHDPKYRGADSRELLKIVIALARNVGYVPDQLDLTILAQVPRILPHKQAMQETLSGLLTLPPHCINIKATTGEHIGFVGRKEGLCVLSHVKMKSLDWWKMI